MGAITEDVFIFFCRDCTLEQDLKDCRIKILFLVFFSQRQWVVNDLTILPQFSFLFFSLNCRVALNGVRSSFVQLACQQESIMVKSTIVVHAFQLDESRNLNGQPAVLLSALEAWRESIQPVGPSRLSALFILLKTLSRQSLSITILARYNVVKQITCL